MRVRYGSNFDAEGYLRRFVSTTLRLPEVTAPHKTPVIVEYLIRKMEEKGMSSIWPILQQHIVQANDKQQYSLRDIDRLIERIEIKRSYFFGNLRASWMHLGLTMLLFWCFSPELTNKITQRNLSITDVLNYYGIDESTNKLKADTDSFSYVIWQIWAASLGADVETETNLIQHMNQEPFGMHGLHVKIIDHGFYRFENERKA